VLGLVAYSNTLHAPFQWDEETYIQGSPVVKDLGYFVDTERAKGLELYGALKSRYIGYLSFALNYAVGGVGLYVVCVVPAVLAMKTKENAFTLPIVIALFEFVFFVGAFKRRALRLVPLLLTLPIIPLTLAGLEKPVGEAIEAIAPATRGYEDLSRGDYFFTELRVIVTYLRLLFLPVG